MERIQLMAGRYDKSFCVSKYYECQDFRVFSIVNIPENEELFKTGVIKETDKFIVLLCWLHNESWFEEAANVLDKYNLNKRNFYVMCNTLYQVKLAKAFGFTNSHYINRHFNLDYNYYKVEQTEKIFDVCIFGEQLERNRIPLSFGLKNLAIVDGNARWNPNWKYPENAWRNSHALGTNGVLIQETMRKSWCGLCISEAESMCWSSLEFFYNGIPVITTYNDTGRMDWYTENNSIIISEDQLQNNLQNVVDSFIDSIKSNKFNPQKIRDEAISKSDAFRAEFLVMTTKLLNNSDLANSLYDIHYEQRMLYEKHWKSLNSTIALF